MYVNILKECKKNVLNGVPSFRQNETGNAV
jgi:hypothetical protein